MKNYERNTERILKDIGTLKTADEKLMALIKKYKELSDHYQKNSIALKQVNKKVTLMQRDNKQIETEKGKAILAKNHLENLCRELQKQNKLVREECLAKVKDEEKKRMEVSAKFQSTLSEVTEIMTRANKRNNKLFEDNIEIERKFNALVGEMMLREQSFENMKQIMNHELQLAKSKLAKVSIEMIEEKETLLSDKNSLLTVGILYNKIVICSRLV